MKIGRMEVDDRRTPEAEVGPQIAAGRDATIHDAGPGRVLRRTPDPRDHALEALAMEHVRGAGYPVPQVFRRGPGELVLERIEGPTMLDDLAARPWAPASTPAPSPSSTVACTRSRPPRPCSPTRWPAAPCCTSTCTPATSSARPTVPW